MYHTSIFLMSLMLCGSVPLLQGCTPNSKPKTVFPKREHQFPDPFIVGSEIVTTFSFTNEGNAPLHIQKIDSDFGNSLLVKEPQTTHEVALAITPKVNSPSSGLIEGTIQIFTTHPDVPEITIPVKAVTP